MRRSVASAGSSGSGKTRTKDKYRVVYTDHQRLELEKEFHYSRYITIRRKSELAANLGLTERQGAEEGEAGRSQRPTPAAASRQRLRPPQPVRGSRGGKGAAVGPALGARLAVCLRSCKRQLQLSKMKKLQGAHLRKPVTPDLLMTPSDQGDVDLDVDFAADRGNWTGKLDFLLSCIGYCVGLGNVWRFPYRAYTNGGGAFLVPYFLMLAICGIPLFFLELSLGQFSSLGPLAVWKISPLFKGAGAAMLLIVGLVAIYYNMIIAYVLFYLFASLTSNLPWEHCGNWWNTERCLEHRGSKDGNGVLPLNLSSTVSPSEEYWSRYVLHIQGSQGIGQPGEIRWNLCLCLLLAWVIVFLCILKGVKSSGKVVYFTATFPYLILLMLLVRGVTLPGAWKGIQFYLTPQFHHLLSSKVWIEAALQIFYSLGVGFGGLLTFASYNTFHQNIYRDTFIVTVGNAITSILAGFAIFSVLGYMSQELGVPVDQVAKAETIVTAVTDEFPYYLRPKKAVFSGLICVAMYLMGLILTTDALLVYSIVKYQPSEYGSYRFPAWAELLGILMGLLSCLMIPAGMLVAVLREEGSLWEPWKLCYPQHQLVSSSLQCPRGKFTDGSLGPPVQKWQSRFPLGTGKFCGVPGHGKHSTPIIIALPQRLQQASRPAIDWGPSLEENRTGMYVATLAGSQSPKPLMVHMRKYGGITSFENTAIEVDREIAEEEEESMM
ncbi:solute carrier family 6 (neurotransmitter transporter L-proline) member 7 [Cricetulus griseus]